MHGSPAVKVFASILLCLLGTGPLFAAGGIFFDDFQIKNNGSVAFLDNFDDRDAKGWTKLNNASVVCDQQGRPPCALLLSRGRLAATAWHGASMVKNPGLVEVSASVFVTPKEEQANWRRGGSSGAWIKLYSGSSDATIQAIVWLHPRQESCHVEVTTRNEAKGTMTQRPVLQLERWSLLTLRMDPRDRTASALIDGKPMVTVRYDPSKFQSLREVGLVSSFGDESQTGK